MSLQNSLSCLIAVLSLQAFGYWEKPIQAPEPELVDSEFVPAFPVEMEDVVIPSRCTHTWTSNLPCQSNPDLERLLEQEYWKFIGDIDTRGMKTWLKKMETYRRHYQSSSESRLSMLGIFGYLFVFSDGPLFDPLRVGLVLKSLHHARQATTELPRSPNSWAFYWAMKNFFYWTLNQKQAGTDAIDQMIQLRDRYGVWGAAGSIGAAVHLMGARDNHLVRSGIQIYRNCEPEVCMRLTSMAPFQDLGMMVTEAEAQAYLGNIDLMHDLLDEVKEQGKNRQWPFSDRVDDYREELVRVDGLLYRWSKGEKLGQFRAPLGVAHRKDACALCHVGAKVPKHYYPRP